MSRSDPQPIPGLGSGTPSRTIPDSGSGIRPGPLMWMLFWMVVGTTAGIVLGLLFVGVGFEVDSGLLGDNIIFTGRLWGAEIFYAEAPNVRAMNDRELKINLERRWKNWLRAGMAITGGLFGLITAIGLCLRSQMVALQARLEVWERLQKRKDLAYEAT